MEALAVVWLIVLAIYFTRTNERQRENHLLVMWALLLAPAVYYAFMLLFDPERGVFFR